MTSTTTRLSSSSTPSTTFRAPALIHMPPPAFPGAAGRRRPPPPQRRPPSARTGIFVWKVCVFISIVIMLSSMIYFTVHPTPGRSVVDERMDVRIMSSSLIVFVVVWMVLSYFSWADTCLCLDDEGQNIPY
uniref:Uncharacterized protein n=1 Tax=Oryza punctata TaxID=4537 RepID=A0A0E0LHI1_ORYPU